MSGRLPNWLSDWLGIISAADADGATWHLHTGWDLAPWVALLFIIAVIALVVWLYAREVSGAGRAYRGLLMSLRLAAFAIVLIMIAQWAVALRLTGPPAIAVVIDRSASMGIADVNLDRENALQLREQLVAHGLSEPTRLNVAKLLLTSDNGRLLRELAGRYRVELYFAAAETERVSDNSNTDQIIRTVHELSSSAPDSHETRLGDALRTVLVNYRSVPPAAVLLLTDGVTTAGIPLMAAAQDIRTKSVPLFTIGLGSEQAARDIVLGDVLVDDAVFVNDLVTLQILIKASSLEGETAQITLRREGDLEPLATETIFLPAGGRTASVRLVHRPTEPGQLAYVVEVAPRDDEKNVDNNRQRRIVDVRDGKIRVLLVGGYPNFEFRFLKTLLERDSNIELATYLQDADPEHADQDKTAVRNFPFSREELFEYDVLLIGDVNPRLLPRSVWQNLRAFAAEQGGGVAFIAGPRYLPWLYQDNPDVAALLPIDLSTANASASGHPLPESSRGFTVRPTPLGMQSPMMQLGETAAETEQIWQNLAPLYWLYEARDPKPAAQILAQSATPVTPSAHAPRGNPRSRSRGEAATQSIEAWRSRTERGTEIPLISFHYVGPGRVLFHAIDSSWRWRVGARDVYFARYWVQTIRFLARGKLAGEGVELTADRREYRRGEPISLRATFRDPRLAPRTDQVSVLVDAPSQARRRIVLRRNPTAEGVFEATVGNLPEGQYEAVLAELQLPAAPPSVRFSIIAPPGEFARLEMDAATLAAAAEATGGKFYTFSTAHRLLDDLPDGRRVPVENLPPIPLWNRWWLLAAFLATITSEWILRKRKGML